MKRILRRLLKPAPQPTPAIRLPAEIRSIDDTDERDIFLAGFPKSGNTWCQSLVSAMLYGFDIPRTPETIVQSLVPDVHFCQHYLRFQTPTCFKTHHLPQPNYRRVIYIMRDGRDAMTSYYHYLRNRIGTDGYDWESIVLNGKGVIPSHWHEHVQAWKKNPYQAEMLTIRYEDLKCDTIPTLRGLAGFIGISLNDRQLADISEMTMFSTMRDREQKFGWAHPFPRDKQFIRRGKIGSYKDEMPADILAQFEGMAGETLRAEGYLSLAQNDNPTTAFPDVASVK